MLHECILPLDDAKLADYYMIFHFFKKSRLNQWLDIALGNINSRKLWELKIYCNKLWIKISWLPAKYLLVNWRVGSGKVSSRKRKRNLSLFLSICREVTKLRIEYYHWQSSVGLLHPRFTCFRYLLYWCIGRINTLVSRKTSIASMSPTGSQ